MTAEAWRVIRRKRKTCRFFAADRSGPKPNRRRSGSCPKRRTSLLRSGLLQTWIEPTFLRLQIDSDRFALLIVRSFLLFCCGEGTATHNLQRKVKIIFYFFVKIGQYRPPFSLCASFQQIKANVLNIKFCRWQDLNHGSLVLEATALPTEPQPLTLLSFLVRVIFF